MSKLVKIEVSNCQRIRFARINPDGTLFVIAGANDAGKSTLLNAVKYLYGGGKTLPEVPLRVGAAQGYIEGTESTGVVTRRTIGKNAGLEVRSAEGVPLSEPQAVCNAKINPLALDPLEFMRMAEDRQLQQLKLMLGLDFSAQQARIKTNYDLRTEVNRTIARIQGNLATLPQVPEDLQPVDVNALLDDLKAVNSSNACIREKIQVAREARDRQATVVTQTREAVLRNQNLIEEREAAVERARAALAAAELDLKASQATLTVVEQQLQGAVNLLADKDNEYQQASKISEVDAGGINQRIASAGDINRKIEQRNQRKAYEVELQAAKAKADEHTKAIEDLEREISATISKAEMPVPGLSFDDNRVLFNGVPLKQAGAATQLRVSSEIAVRQIPADGLRVLLVRDGSLLDLESRQQLHDLAVRYDVNILFELVGDVGDVVLEDGEVKTTKEEPHAEQS